MGRAKRLIPKYLPDKLKLTRINMGFSLERMVSKLEVELASLGYTEINLYSGNISEFEQGKREPSLPVLLAYARLSKTNVEVLIDDKLEFHLKD